MGNITFTLASDAPDWYASLSDIQVCRILKNHIKLASISKVIDNYDQLAIIVHEYNNSVSKELGEHEDVSRSKDQSPNSRIQVMFRLKPSQSGII